MNLIGELVVERTPCRIWPSEPKCSLAAANFPAKSKASIQ